MEHHLLGLICLPTHHIRQNHYTRRLNYITQSYGGSVHSLGTGNTCGCVGGCAKNVLVYTIAALYVCIVHYTHTHIDTHTHTPTHVYVLVTCSHAAIVHTLSHLHTLHSYHNFPFTSLSMNPASWQLRNGEGIAQAKKPKAGPTRLPFCYQFRSICHTQQLMECRNSKKVIFPFRSHATAKFRSVPAHLRQKTIISRIRSQ